MEKNEIAHLKIFALRHRLFLGEGTFLLASEQFFFLLLKNCRDYGIVMIKRGRLFFYSFPKCPA